MYSLRNDIPNSHKIRNIIFDFGGVICDIDVTRTEQKFIEFGDPLVTGPVGETPKLFIDLVTGLEKGQVSVEAFMNAIQRHYQKPPSPEAILDAWNALLGDIPEHRVRLLEEMRGVYNIYFLSNTNIIHYRKYLYDFQMKFGYKRFEDLVRKFYLSYEIGLIKPGREVYDYVIRDAGIDPAETLFVDDTPENVEGSLQAGLIGYYLKEEEDISALFVR